jgi:hypothetical protein
MFNFKRKITMSKNVNQLSEGDQKPQTGQDLQSRKSRKNNFNNLLSAKGQTLNKK